MLSAFILLCLIFAFLLIFLLSRPPFLSAYSLKRYMLSFSLRLPNFNMLWSLFIVRYCYKEGIRFKSVPLLFEQSLIYIFI